MKTLKTNDVLKDLQNKELVENETKITVGLLLSNILSNAQTPNPHRSYQLAKAFATEKEVELKAEDVVYLKDIISKYTALGALYTGQLIDILESSNK